MANRFIILIKIEASSRFSSLCGAEASHKRSLYVEMMGLIGAGNNPMVGMTVACAVAVEEAMK